MGDGDDLGGSNDQHSRQVKQSALTQFQRIMALNRPIHSTPDSFSNNGEKQPKKAGKQRLRNFFCVHPECDKAFADNAHLRDHMFVHNGEKSFICPDCNKSFARLSSLKVHLRIHSGEKPFQCPVNGCNKAYSTRGSLRKHEGAHANYKCNRCKMVFKSLDSVNKHSCLNATTALIECTECQISFTSDAELQKHGVEEHVLKCSNPTCHTVYMGLQEQINELRQQLTKFKRGSAGGESSIQRAKKPRSTHPNHDLQVPMVAPLRFLTGSKPFECMVPQCDKTFSNFYQLTYHAKSHSVSHDIVIGSQEPLVVGPKFCPVDGCEFNQETGKFMKTLQIAKRHWQRCHQSARPFLCPDCPDKSFKTRDNMTAHRRECHKR